MVNFDDLIIPFLENLWIFILSNSRYLERAEVYRLLGEIEKAIEDENTAKKL